MERDSVYERVQIFNSPSTQVVNDRDAVSLVEAPRNYGTTDEPSTASDDDAFFSNGV